VRLRHLFPFDAKVEYIPLKRRIIDDPKTIGEKLCNKRIELGLIQSEMAKIFGVCPDTITNWENNRGEPQIQLYPRIIKFLGYLPMKIDTSTLGGKIKEDRYLHGLSQEQLAYHLGVNESTIFHCENRKHKPMTKTAKKIKLLMKNRVSF
jgi:DNA-binding XRE family transcriptional regulator